MIPRQKITINDVAREAGVHRSTVSRVLTGNGPVSPVRRERILGAIRKLNYHPNALAGALKSRRRDSWGLLVFEEGDFFARAFPALLDAAGQKGMRVVIRREGDTLNEIETGKFCHDAQMAGLFLLGAPKGLDREGLLSGLDIPVVELDPREPEPSAFLSLL